MEIHHDAIVLLCVPGEERELLEVVQEALRKGTG
jgi:hypothetical protein